VMIVMIVMIVMAVMVIMLMLMTMLMVVMVMPMIMRMPVRAILGIERRHHGNALQSSLRQQGLVLGRAQQAYPVGENLHRHMAVAEHQDEARERGKILRPHLQERFGVGHHFDQPAVVEHQEIVGAQKGRFGKIELDAGALAAEREALPSAAVIEFEQQHIDDLAARFARCETFLGARHELDDQWRVGRPPSPVASGTGGFSGEGAPGWAGVSAGLPALPWLSASASRRR
jgi:hypothetical protein